MKKPKRQKPKPHHLREPEPMEEKKVKPDNSVAARFARIQPHPKKKFTSTDEIEAWLNSLEK
jgi:hypothetical protein